MLTQHVADARRLIEEHLKLNPEARIVVAGVPRAGKTTLCGGLPNVMATDNVIELGWSEASLYIAEDWFSQPGPWIVEGVAAMRAVRKWFTLGKEGKPCDLVIWLDQPLADLTTGQKAMAVGCGTIMRSTIGALATAGVAWVEFR